MVKRVKFMLCAFCHKGKSFKKKAALQTKVAAKLIYQNVKPVYNIVT